MNFDPQSFESLYLDALGSSVGDQELVLIYAGKQKEVWHAYGPMNFIRIGEDLISFACFLPSVLEYGGFKYYWKSYNYMGQQGLTVDGHLKSIIFDIYFNNGDVEMIANIFQHNILFGVAVCTTMIIGMCLWRLLFFPICQVTKKICWKFQKRLVSEITN